jgi:phosphodiesterase/alkaline phosphatase D-like protein
MTVAAFATFAALLFSTAPALAVAPAVVSQSVPSVTPFEARLEATVKAAENPNPAEEPTECHFEYGKTSVTENKVECEQGNALEGGEQSVSLNVTVPVPGTPLIPSTPYHYRVVVKNIMGEVKGTGVPAEEEFTTATAVKPEVESENASAVNSTEATLETQVNPDYQKTTYTFEYANNKALTGAKTLKGTVEGPPGQTASVLASGLEPGAVYYYRVVAENETSEGEGIPVDGAVRSFTTVPTPFTDAPTSVTGTGAVFKGHFTLDPVATKYSFEYNLGNTTECTPEGSTPTIEVGSGESEVAEAWGVPSAEEPALGWPAAPPLKPNMEYTVCFVTSNVYGSQVGSSVHFPTPPAPPAIDGESASGQGPAGMTLEARIDPNLQETTYSFEYATSEAAFGEGTATKVAGEKPLAAELAELPVSVKIAVVPQPGTTYYYRVVAENESTGKEGHPATGEIKSFALPFLTTGEAQSITRTTATLSGTVNPTGVETTYYFAYISEAAFQEALKNGAADPNEGEAAYQAALAKGAANPYAEGETTAPLSSSSDEPQTIAPTPATGLLPGETYHYALIARNVVGVTIGPDRTLTTLSGTPPIVSTGGASGVSQNAATLSGTVATNSLQTNYGFEIGTEPGNYGPATGLGSLGGAATEEVHVTLGELQPGTTYYYRVAATNADGTVQGAPQSFTTTGFPTLIAPPASPPLVAYTSPGFPTGSLENTQSPTIAVVSHKVKGKTATIKVSVPSAGKLVATGKGVSKGTGKASKAEDVTVKVTLTKKEQALLAKHKGHKRKVAVKLTFTPTKGAKLTTSVTVLVG